MNIAAYGFAIWETFYVTVLSTAFALVLGLPLGVLLVAGDKDGILPLPGWLMHLINIVINILRSVPFLILMICVFPLTRAIVGTTVGTKATVVPLVVAAFPFVARLVETSLRELDEGVVEAAQSMGATPFQIITKVMIPECLPGLISSMTTALTTILGYSAMSGVIGGGHGHSPYCWVSVSHVTSGSSSRAAAIDAFHVSERDCHSPYSKSNCSCVLPAIACS